MISRLLVANRGEIARRILRTCRTLGIEGVAVYSDADRALPHVSEADLAVHIGPAVAAESYLSFEAILGAAQRVGADAIHPGYGFLSENARFARAVTEAGLLWVGPPPDAIEAMGDKASARALAEAQGVPTVPGFQGDQDDAALAKAAEDLGYPVLIKAIAGGGGRGMRRVASSDAFAEALASARREAESAFGNGEVLLERYVERPRHIEVQVFADTHGAVLHLGERECSIQRRHQKVIEEAPSPAVDADLRARMGEAACAVARAASYEGAGTVEFILDEQGQFFFLEMNTRLQVEHPVTECVTGLDLVAWQIAVAEGQPLPLRQDEVQIKGWSIEARVVAEDSLRDFLPAVGPLLRVDLGEPSARLRIDAGYTSGDAVSPWYDSLVAKVIATGRDRNEANRVLRRALERAWMPGVLNNLPLLRQVVSHPAWESGDLHTHFLEAYGLPEAPPLNLASGAIGATALGWWQRRQRAPIPGVPAGWRLHGAQEQSDRFHCGEAEIEVRWTAEGDTLTLQTDQDGTQHSHRVQVHGLDGDRLSLTLDGVRSQWRVLWVPASPTHATLDDGDTVYVHTGAGEAFVRLHPRFPVSSGVQADPGSAVAPTPGTVSAVHVEVGAAVEAGDRLVTLEAMKMEHAVLAAEPGTVAEVRVAAGDVVDEGMLLVRLEQDGD